jgi:C-terminal processing protease CtpA/Prc
MLGRFFSAPLTIGEHCLPAREGEKTRDCTQHRIEPRGKVYTGPLAVIIDENVYSAGELAAYALCRSGRARCFGRTTAGETDCVFKLDLPGAVARLSWADFRPAIGPSILGNGLEPDVRVERTLEDLKAGLDPEYEMARAWLRSDRTAPPALEIAAGTRLPHPGEPAPASPRGR